MRIQWENMYEIFFITSGTWQVYVSVYLMNRNDILSNEVRVPCISRQKEYEVSS